MTFNSLQYFAFFAVVVLVYFRLGRAGQNRWMVAASALFYGLFDYRFLGLLTVSVLVDFAVAQRIAASDDRRMRRRWFAVSIVVELGILGFFKYADFFSDSAASALSRLGFEADFFTLNVLLPVGISFYTFQSLAYVRSVYTDEVEAERDLVTFAAFVSWFPQLVAGPIERATSLLPRIRRRRNVPPAEVIESGVALILQGLFKKVVLADGLAGYVNDVYGAPDEYGWMALVTATVGFAIQVYGDFSGYTDIARGSSRVLGVELRRNFEQPFLSRDIQELWRRWHTSLSGWFVEFVAQPLGAARRGRLGSSVVVIVMFSLIGLWHGAAWTFVIWGFGNGVLVAIWRHVPAPRGRHPMRLRVREIPSIATTFGLFCLGLVFFRSDSVASAMTILGRIAGLADGATGGVNRAMLIPIMLGLMLVIDLAERRQRIDAIETLRIRAQLGSVASELEAVIESPSRAMGPSLTGVSAGFMVVAIIVFSGGAPTPFVYFQF